MKRDCTGGVFRGRQLGPPPPPHSTRGILKGAEDVGEGGSPSTIINKFLLVLLAEKILSRVPGVY